MASLHNPYHEGKINQTIDKIRNKGESINNPGMTMRFIRSDDNLYDNVQTPIAEAVMNQINKEL